MCERVSRSWRCDRPGAAYEGGSVSPTPAIPPRAHQKAVSSRVYKSHSKPCSRCRTQPASTARQRLLQAVPRRLPARVACPPEDRRRAAGNGVADAGHAARASARHPDPRGDGAVPADLTVERLPCRPPPLGWRRSKKPRREFRMSVRRSTTFAAALAVGLAPLAVSASEFINILTGGTSGVYYPMGVALSQIYGAEHPRRPRAGAGDQGLGREPEPPAGRQGRARLLARRLGQARLGGRRRGRLRPAARQAARASPRSTRTTSRSSPPPTAASPTSRA